MYNTSKTSTTSNTSSRPFWALWITKDGKPSAATRCESGADILGLSCGKALYVVTNRNATSTARPFWAVWITKDDKLSSITRLESGADVLGLACGKALYIFTSRAEAESFCAYYIRKKNHDAYVENLNALEACDKFELLSYIATAYSLHEIDGARYGVQVDFTSDGPSFLVDEEATISRRSLLISTDMCDLDRVYIPEDIPRLMKADKNRWRDNLDNDELRYFCSAYSAGMADLAVNFWAANNDC